MNGAPCLRCGDFLKEPVLAGLDICATCLDGERTPKYRTMLPRTIILARLRLLIIFPFLMGLGGVIAGFPGILVGELLCGVIALTFAWHMGIKKYRAEILEKVELRFPPGRGWFVLYLTEKPKLWSIRIPFTWGFLVESEGGFAFVGDEDVRAVVPFDSIVKASVERILMNQPGSALRLDLTTGHAVFFMIKEHTTFRANRSMALDMAARVNARVTIKA